MMILSRYIDLASIRSGPEALVSTSFVMGVFVRAEGSYPLVSAEVRVGRRVFVRGPVPAS